MGSKSKSKSYNLNNDLIKSQFSSTAQNTGNVSSGLSALLGLGGDTAGQNAAFNNWKNSTGYNFAFDEAMRGVNGGAAGAGVYGSGARLKGLQDRASGLASQSYNDYISQMLGLGNLGLGAGGLITSAGQFSKSKSKQGLGDTLASFGQAAGAAAAMSDMRVKKNIQKIGTLSDGLGIYSFSYIWDNDEDTQVGVMAQEVAELRPWALGPETEDGYMSVLYHKLDDQLEVLN